MVEVMLGVVLMVLTAFSTSYNITLHLHLFRVWSWFKWLGLKLMRWGFWLVHGLLHCFCITVFIASYLFFVMAIVLHCLILVVSLVLMGAVFVTMVVVGLSDVLYGMVLV